MKGTDDASDNPYFPLYILTVTRGQGPHDRETGQECGPNRLAPREAADFEVRDDPREGDDGLDLEVFQGSLQRHRGQVRAPLRPPAGQIVGRSGPVCRPGLRYACRSDRDTWQYPNMTLFEETFRQLLPLMPKDAIIVFDN